MTAHGGGGVALCVSNGLHHQEARKKGNGMIGPHHSASSLLPPLLFLYLSAAIHQRVSALAGSLSSLTPFATCPTPPETYFCPVGGASSFITYIRSGGEMELGGGKGKATAAYRALV